MNLSDKDFASLFSKTLKGAKLAATKMTIDEEDTEGEKTFVFILNRKSGSVKAHFLSLHPHKGYLLPHIQSITWPKIKGWVDYTSVVLRNCLYIMGGKERETGKLTSKVLKYDPAEDKWTQLSNLKRPKAYFTADVMENRIVIMGGEGNNGDVLDSIESYEPLIDTWSVEGKLPEARKNHSTAVINSRIFICGGQGPSSAFNSNLWELRRDFRVIGEKEIFFHQWYEEWGQVYTRKIQQTMLYPVLGKLFCMGGLVQGPTEDGRRLADEMDIDEANSDDEEEEERRRRKQTEPYVPTYMKMLADESKQARRKGPKNVTRTTRTMMSIEVSNNLLRQKNPFNGVTDEKRMLQARAGASLILLGNRLYMIGGYRLEDEELFVPRVQYYHIKKKKWINAFDLKTYDNETFRDIQVHKISIPCSNPNFRVLNAAYKYPMW